MSHNYQTPQRQMAKRRKHGPIFVISSLLNSERICEGMWIKTATSPQICCRTTLRNISGQLYSGTFILATIICFMSGSICFMSFYFRPIYFFFLILTSLWHYCKILFVVLLIPFNYENKRLTQRWTTHNWLSHWRVAFTTQNMHMCRRRTF